MNTSVDLSFDAANLLENQLNTEDFLPDDFLSPSKQSRSSARKPAELGGSIPDLRYLALANELFSATHHLRETESLQNDKITKLLRQLGDDNEEYDMDDKLRTRVFKGRFNGGRKLDNLDAFDMHLDSFLGNGLRSPVKQAYETRNDENKENMCPVLEPSKRKLSDSDRRMPLKKLKSYANMPTLKKTKLAPVPTGRSVTMSPTSSPKRVCTPRDTSTPGRPSLKHRRNLSIFLVDSLTGSVNDATQFGTELNSSNCEGFPLPDDVNEIVQIPTNDATTPSAAQKMAIIKAVYGVRHGSAGDNSSRTGFYSKKEFDDFKLHKQPREEKLVAAGRSVRWAEELEW